ncbi:MAG: SDR family NAD(P)-dependent oxidoreductase [Cyanomargarita calcarea GSE-NOS-MK-12-04C]|jgi:light-dependent protochlorophyllide reductase|uniref:SDR family NAD(P)-dependent oxidoreductase n=1 Tax=Cyanomargarita calcarea GSE-NOS-MK-12-04C TaxID=2839659 RepID=A0A951QS54_9CYAN|nr:SDR family NAD(P)-dependent oxidoreductase [Cyanomargarita calcarea GSE-NOS-MK-12-04C]
MQNPTQANKTVIITGANGGLGYYCAEAIARYGQDWHIIIASRNPSKVDEAVRNLMTETEYPYIEGMALDLASLASARQFVQDFINGERPPLQAIVCNAGIQIVSDALYTEDGFEMTFGVNHLGHFLLVNLLSPHLSDRARVVFVSSDAHNPDVNTGMPHPRYQDAKLLAFPADYVDDTDIGNTGRTRYTTSKLCNILCAYELSRRLQKQQSKITVNAFNPGLMLDTQLGRDYSQAELSAFSTTISRTVLEKAKDSKAMGSALARLILDPSLDNVTGKYFDGLEEVQSSDESYNEKQATELWESSAALVKLSPRKAMLLQ